MSGARRRRRRNWTLIVGAGLLTVLVLAAVLAPLISPHDPEQIEPARVLVGPSAGHPFGSDDSGRDVLSRLLYAYRVSLGVAVASVAASLVIGLLLGIVSGFRGGWIDMLLMRPVDMMLAFPAMLLAVTMVAILGSGSVVVIVAIAIIYVPVFARVVRSATLGVATMGYVAASRARGASPARIMTLHVLPNVIGPAIVQASILAGIAIQIEASLSFLGLGAQPPTPSLGSMLSQGRDYLQDAPWVEIFPGVAIAVTVLAFVLLGDGLRSRLDHERARA